VVAAGIKTFGDTIKIVQNGTNKDVLISGIFGGSDEALSLAGNNWTTVTITTEQA
jgi:hypothetical protein